MDSPSNVVVLNRHSPVPAPQLCPDCQLPGPRDSQAGICSCVMQLPSMISQPRPPCFTFLFCMYTASPSCDSCARPFVSSPSSTALVTPRTSLGLSELVHLGHPLLELDVLALFVAVSLVLWCGQYCQLPRDESGSGASRLTGTLGWNPYVALPGKVVCVLTTTVEGDQEVAAAVAVRHGEFGITHLLAGRLCVLVTLANMTQIIGCEWGKQHTPRDLGSRACRHFCCN